MFVPLIVELTDTLTLSIKKRMLQTNYITFSITTFLQTYLIWIS